MAKNIPGFGNAPKLGETQEPSSSPSSAGIGSFGGGPTVGPPLHKGEKQVGGPGPDVYPEVYGGAPVTGERSKRSRSAKGNGVGGAGTIP